MSSNAQLIVMLATMIGGLKVKAYGKQNKNQLWRVEQVEARL